MNEELLLDVRDLTVEFAFRRQSLTAVDGVSFSLARGERLGIVGESGAGKSVTGFALLNLISKPGRISRGSVRFEGRELTRLSEEELRRLRGDRIAMIFQDPMMTLNPVLTIGTQLIETLQAHQSVSRKDAEAAAVEALRKVYISSPERRLRQYPHEFSGGMRQRIVIAIALLARPALIIADEPTTALDVTIQAEIMALLLELCQAERMGLILITHDLAVVSQVSRKIAVMYAGRIVEMGSTERIVSAPSHPYTRGLLAALPQSGASGTYRASGGRGARLNQIPGVMPGLAHIPAGCAFSDRCGQCEAVCRASAPLLEAKKTGCLAACHLLE